MLNVETPLCDHIISWLIHHSDAALSRLTTLILDYFEFDLDSVLNIPPKTGELCASASGTLDYLSIKACVSGMVAIRNRIAAH
jgi:hypothetical protein